MQISPLSETWKHLWPGHRPTSLMELPSLARFARVARVFVKVEGERPLGSFKSLGGMTAGLYGRKGCRVPIVGSCSDGCSIATPASLG